MAQQQTDVNPSTASADGPVLDGNGNPVPLPPSIVPDAAFRAFMAGRVPAKECEHYIYKSEAAAGITTCERC